MRSPIYTAVRRGRRRKVGGGLGAQGGTGSSSGLEEGVPLSQRRRVLDRFEGGGEAGCKDRSSYCP
jgi:hypothetical protein